MTEYRTRRHAVFDIKYHFVWITTYLYKILRGRVAERARDLLRQICQPREVVIVRGAASPNHIHMLVSSPPQMAPAKIVPYLKGRSSRRLQDEFPELRETIPGTSLVGAGILLRECGRGRRGDDPEVHREPKVG
jgi:putative transposase